MKKRVVVIGAGIAGLVAAHDLGKAGFEVTVIESNAYAGGRMADINMKGLNVHSGATVLFSFYHDMLDLVRELGLENDIHWWQREEIRVHNGTTEYPIKYHADLPFLATHPALSLATKAKLAKLLPDLVRSGLHTDPNLMHTAAQYDDESVADYFRRKGLSEFVENYLEPLFRAPWNWEPEDISRAYFMSIFGHLLKAKSFGFRPGIGHLSRVLASRLKVRLQTTAKRVVPNGSGGHHVECQAVNGESLRLEADLVISAIQGTRVNALFPNLDSEDRGFFSSVRYTPVGIVYYLLKQAPQPRHLWFTRNHPSPIVLYQQFDTDTAVPTGHLQPPHLYCELSPQVNAQVRRDGGEKALDRYCRDQARKFYPALEQDMYDVVEQWIEEMLPLWQVGYTRAMTAFLARQETTPRTLYFCGDYLSHSHTGGAVASGRRLAKQIAKQWPVVGSHVPAG